MEDKEIKLFLNKLGIKAKGIKAYLYCLEHGPQLATNIAKICNTSRTNAYDIIKKLEQSGLCHTVGSNYGRKIKANEPKEIDDYLNNKNKEIDSLKNELKEVLPFFKIAKNTISPFTRVSFYEGSENVRKMIWKSLQTQNKQVKIAGSELDMVSSLGKDFAIEFNERRSTKNIHLFALRPDSHRTKGQVFENDNKYNREIRIRPKGEVRLKSNMIIWDNCLAFYSLKNKIIFGTLIESDDMSIMLESWFDYIWKNSKPI